MKLTLSEIAKNTNGLQNGDAIIENISINSKEILENTLFIGIKGKNFDGNEYAQEAIQNGAKALLTTTKLENFPQVLVSDSNQALLDLAKGYKEKFKELKTVAITGSVGKTTTKEMIYSVLAEIGKTHKNKGNLNNHIGVPLTLLDLEDDYKFAVIEMGMSDFKEIEVLSIATQPNIGIISNIGVSHIEFLGSREGICKAKLEILKGLQDILIVNADEPLLQNINTDKTILTFGIENEKADIIAKNIEIFEEYMTFDAIYKEKNIKISINDIGKHNVYNALSAILCGILYGASNKQIQSGLLKFKNADMRQNIYKFQEHIIIDDCYNASSPQSVFASLDVLKIKGDGHKIAVLGAMRELGEYSKKSHTEVLEYALKIADFIYLYGEEWQEIDNKSAKYFNDKNMLLNDLKMHTKSSDTLLFKGSRSTKMEEVLKLFKCEV